MKRSQTQFRRKDERDYRHSSSGTQSLCVNHNQQYKSRGKQKRDYYKGRHGHNTRKESLWQHEKGKKSAKKYCSQISYSKLPSELDETRDEIEIPGFYYDREKKRYFKIQPNHSNISSTVTRETITKKEKEEQRQKHLSDVPKLLFSHLPSPHRNSEVCHLPALLNRLHTGLSTSEIIDKLFQQRRLVNLRNKPQCEKVPHLDYNTTFRPSNIENMQHILVGKNDSSVVGLWSEKESLRKTLKLLSIEKKQRVSENKQQMIDFRVNVASESFLFYKVTNICWADIGDKIETNTHVLHTSMTYTGEMNSSAVIRNVDNFSDTHSFSLGNKCIWTCAWNPRGGNFSVGTEKNALLIDVNTRKMWELYTNNSDPLSQIFASKTSHCLYSGTRRKQIFCHDLRSISTRPVFYLSQSNSVCSLNSLQDEYKLLASDVNGKVCLWETRTRKVLVEYKGISNRYHMLPVHVDNAERIVYGVDQDGYTRFWCLKTGELLKCLPPPSALAHEYIPSIAYSEQWAGQRGNAGLFMGLGDFLYFYPTFQE